MPTTILGIDPGTLVTGYGLITRDPPLTLITHGQIKPRQSMPIEKRLHQIHTELLATIDLLQPDLIAVEEPFFGKSARSSMAVGQAQTLALIAAASRNIEIRKFPPAQVKQRITGTGAATKQQVKNAVCMILGAPDTISADTADAIAVAHCAALHHQQDNAISKATA